MPLQSTMAVQIIESNENVSEIQVLTSRAQDLARSIGRWNDAYVILVAATVLLAAALFIAQFVVIRKSKQLSDVQAKISGIKEAGAKVEQDRISTELAAAVARAREADARIAEAQRGVAEANALATRAQSSLALAEQHSAEANSKAEGFRADIARANDSAKQAEARAAEANLELARFKAPRALSPPQQTKIAGLLRSFGARRVDVIIIGDGREIADITGAIVAAIQQAGWTVNVVGKAISGPNVSGILVGTHIGSDREVNSAADALILGLQSAGIVTGRFTPQFGDELPMAIMGNWDAKNVAPIRMLVSTKP